MPKQPLDLPRTPDLYKEIMGIRGKTRRKKVKIPAAKKIYIWEHPETFGRTCSICGKKITKLSDLELDHTRPFSKGGRKMALAHRDCNRLKSDKSLREIQKFMGVKTTKRKRKIKARTKRKKPSNVISLPKVKIPKGLL